MECDEDNLRKNIQSIGDQAFPDDQVVWTITKIIPNGDYVVAEVKPSPNTVGYERYVFVSKVESIDSYRLSSCFVWDDGEWDLLFSDEGEDSAWRSLLDSI